MNEAAAICRMRPTDAAASFATIKASADALWGKLWQGEKPLIMVGAATCGRSAGALLVLEVLKREIAERGLDCHLIEAGCMGHCYAEPLVVIRKPGATPICYRQVDAAIARRLIRDYLINDRPCLENALGALSESDILPALSELPRARYEHRIVLRNCGLIDPGSIEQAIALGGYGALAKALAMRPGEIIEQIKRSGLRGRGGAGYPAGAKWEACHDAPGETKYVVCNGDEGDPGAFLDRTLLESDPHSVLEGMIIAGYAMGANRGYIYVRSEYPLAAERLRAAIRQAGEHNLLGAEILGSGFDFTITLFQGAGAFICGEETALIASLEGKPGVPSHRPPWPAAEGLHRSPTLIHNVKTFAYVRHIVNEGAHRFAGIGARAGSGTAIFALAGKVVCTGLIEAPMGATLRDIIYGAGGGIADGKRFRAVLVGGPSGGFLPESALDTPVDFDALTELGAMMGSGGMIVFDEDDCMVEMARYFLEFTAQESCGKCTFCRLGVQQMLALLTGFTRGQGSLKDLELLEALAHDVRAGSLCGLGKTAPNPVLSTLRYFRQEYEAHIGEGYCQGLMCKDLISYQFRRVACSAACNTCESVCDAICHRDMSDGYRVKYHYRAIDREKCTKCGACLDDRATRIFSSCWRHQYERVSPVVKVSPADRMPE